MFSCLQDSLERAKADAAAAVGGGLFVGTTPTAALQEKLRKAQEENQRLQNKVLRLDQEPARDQDLEERYNKLLEVSFLKAHPCFTKQLYCFGCMTALCWPECLCNTSRAESYGIKSALAWPINFACTGKRYLFMYRRGMVSLGWILLLALTRAACKLNHRDYLGICGLASLQS